MNAQGSGSSSTVALILGILGILCCPILAPIAWYLGSQAPPEDGTGKAAMILGIIGTILFVLTLLWLFLAGGLAVLQGMMGGSF